MKRKVLLTMLCLAISVSIVACGTETTAEQQEVIATEQTTETETVEEQETETEIELSELEQQIEEFKNTTSSEITVTQDVLRGQWRVGDMLTLEGDAYYGEPFRLGNLRVDYDTSSKKSNVIFTNNEFVASYDDARVYIATDENKNMQCTLVVSGLYRVINQGEIDEENDCFSSEIELLITDVTSQSDAIDTDVCNELNSVIGTTIQKKVELSEAYMDLSYITEEQLAEYDMEIHDSITLEVTGTFGYRQDGSYGMVNYDTPIISQDNPVTFAWIGRENNNELFANTVRMKMKNTVDADYGDVEPGVFLYDVIHPNEDTITE